MFYSDYSETDKFLDELFAEDAELGWACPRPNHENKSGVTMTIVKGVNNNSPEEQYATALSEEISEKLQEIINFIPSLDDESQDTFITKQSVIQRLIDVLNNLNSISKDFESIQTANNLNNMASAPMDTIVNGAVPMMF